MQFHSPSTIGGAAQGEILDAHERNFSFSLHSPNTISFNLLPQNQIVTNILLAKAGLITLWRDTTLAMTAELSRVRLNSGEDDHEVSVVATETMYPRLSHRLVGKSSAGLKGPTSATDQGTWLMQVLQTGTLNLNLEDESSLRPGTITASGNITGGTWRYKPFLELMQELGATVNGFDFYQRPLNPPDWPVTVGALTGTIDIAPIIGTTKSNVVFEYGLGARNASDYEYLIDSESMIDRAIGLPPEFPDNPGNKVATVTDAPAVASRGLREEVIPTDLNDLTFRTQLAQLHVNLRKQPREQFVIQPSPASGSRPVPKFLVDYNIGDTIRGRVQDQNRLLLDALVRVYGAQVNLDDEGVETIDLTVINEA